MNNKESYDQILYIEKYKSIFILIISLAICGVIGIVFEESPDLSSPIFSSIYLVSSFIVILLTNSILKVEKTGYYKFVRMIFYCIIIYNIKYMVPKISMSNSFIIGSYTDSSTISLLMNAMALVFFKISTIINKKVIKNKFLYIIFFSLLIINHIFLIAGMTNGISFFINIINVYLVVLIKFNLKEYKVIKDKEVNVFKLAITMLTLVSCLNMIVIISDTNIAAVSIAMDIIFFVCFFMYTYFTLEKVLNSPYKGLFNDLYEQNLKMNKLNNQIERKNMELEFSQVVIKKKEKMFKNFFTNISVPLVIVSNNERVLFTNTSFKNLINEDILKNIINKKIFSIILVEDHVNILEAATNKDNIVSGQVIIKNEIKFIDMEFIDISEGREEILIIFNDVTSKIKVNELKAQMENTLFQEKIKTDFLSNISHDLKTPINVIYSASQLINVYIKSNNIEALKKYNVISRINCLMLIRLTNNLIDSSRIYSDYLSANLHIQNIVEIVEETVTSLVEYAKNKEVNLIFDTEEEEIYLNIDEDFIKRIIINLISNAIKFSKKNGEISVVIEDFKDEVLMKIKDNGVGMEQKFIQEAFSRYSMGDNNKQLLENGTGIGLFVVKNLVEKQGGSISIHSEVNKGTDIEMRFKKELVYEH
jgi:signal transduction histidine kinase